MLNTVNLATATPLSVNSDWKNKSGLLSLGDSNDVYSLAVSKASSLNLNLSTIGAGNLFAIVRDGDGNNKIDDNEILLRSSQTSVIQNVQLAVGSYFIVADLTTLPSGMSTASYEFGISYASQSKVLWRDALNNNQVGFWDFTMTANGPQMTSTQLTWSGIDPGWKIESTGDINGDGVTDVLWRNTITNNVGFGAFKVDLPNGQSLSASRGQLIALSGLESPSGTVKNPLVRFLPEAESYRTYLTF